MPRYEVVWRRMPYWVTEHKDGGGVWYKLHWQDSVTMSDSRVVGVGDCLTELTRGLGESRKLRW